MSYRSYSSLRKTLLASVVLPAGLIAAGVLGGCGISSSAPEAVTMSGMTGVVHGGQTPIEGAVVKLYVTSATAAVYGQPATLIGTDTTDSNGSFTIAPSATTANCPAGQQAYVTASGGYQAGSTATANTSSLLMAALGDCANVSAATNVVINEVTTVAAAYALSGFTTISAGPIVNVNAPVANSGTTGTAAVAAGLAHAFLNAATLADVTDGTANSQTANVSVAGTTLNGEVPAVEINTLADVLQSCVDGLTGNASCVTLFGFTPSISGVAPTNTLQAAIDLARNPYPSAAAMDPTTGLLSLATATSAFQPILSAVPPDWALAVVYKGTPFANPYDLALDANDTAYQGGSATAATLVGLSAYGVATPAFTAGTGTATRAIAPDALGNIWIANNAADVYGYSATTGGAATYTIALTASSKEAWGVAVDKANNVWVGNANLVTPNVTQYLYAAGTGGNPATYTANYGATVNNGFEPTGMTIDANQNVWIAPYYTSGTDADVLANLTPGGTPSYASTGTTVTPISATLSASPAKPLGLAIDANGNAWYGITGSNSVTTTGIEEVVPTVTASVITALDTTPALVTGAVLGAKASQIPGIDGAGTLYLPDNQGSGALGIHAYSTVAVSSSDTGSQVLSPPAGYLGCAPAAAAPTTCGTGSASAVYNPREIVIDSTGSVWAGISTSGGFTQLIGLGAPTWPLLSIGKPGLAPGLTAVMPLP